MRKGTIFSLIFVPGIPTRCYHQSYFRNIARISSKAGHCPCVVIDDFKESIWTDSHLPQAVSDSSHVVMYSQHVVKHWWRHVFFWRKLWEINMHTVLWTLQITLSTESHSEWIREKAPFCLGLEFLLRSWHHGSFSESNLIKSYLI